MFHNQAPSSDSEQSLEQAAHLIQTRADFVEFTQQLLLDLQQNPRAWDNRDLTAFLAALAAWVEDLEGYCENRGHKAPEHPSWRLVGEMLLAARVYE